MAILGREIAEILSPELLLLVSADCYPGTVMYILRFKFVDHPGVYHNWYVAYFYGFS